MCFEYAAVCVSFTYLWESCHMTYFIVTECDVWEIKSTSVTHVMNHDMLSRVN